MQKRKIEDSKIWEAYNRIMSGESLTQVANSEDISLNRGTLRKYIETVVEPGLDEMEKEKFDRIINKNYRGNSTENKRQNRNGIRKRAAENIEKSEAMQELAGYGVTPDNIEDLYKRLKENKRTSFSRDTYIYKCLEHLSVLTEIGFSTEEAFTIFMKRPKLFSGSANRIREIFNKLFLKYGSESAARQRLVEDPWADLKNKKEKANKVEPESLGDGGGR